MHVQAKEGHKESEDILQQDVAPALTCALHGFGGP